MHYSGAGEGGSRKTP